MGLITKEVEVKLVSNNLNYFEDKGYEIPRYKDKRGRMKVKRDTTILVKSNDLPDGSHVRVNVECDKCGKILENIYWQSYIKCLKDDNTYYCEKCGYELFAVNNIKNTRLKNGKSFEQWCIENNKQDILGRWDYELNNLKPYEINHSTSKKYYFKCPRGLHESELKCISNFVHGSEGVMNCLQCNSIAQWGINKLDKDFLNKYWNWEKNKNIDPWKISYGSSQKVWIKCQTSNCFNSYPVRCFDFTMSNSRCPKCIMTKGETTIDVYLTNDNWLKILYKEYNNITTDNINKDYYTVQKKFKGLIGINGGLLSYDFFIPKLNLLIEFQGQQHEKFIKRFHKSIEDFEKQVEHDRRKKEYAENNNIRLLEIWYYDFDRIEEILNKQLKGGE